MLARPRYRSKRLREFFQCPPYVLFRKFQSKRHHDMNGALCHLILRGVDDQKSATLPGQFKIFLEPGRFLSNLNRTDGVILIAHKLPQNFVLIVMCDLFLAEAVAKECLTRLFSISIGREGRYDMPRRTKSTERPWETRLRRFPHLHSPETRGHISTASPNLLAPGLFQIRVRLPA